MSEYKTFNISYTMVDGEEFKRIIDRESYGEAWVIVRKELEGTCFGLGQRPETILVSANVRNVDIIEKL